jgi:nitric oxide reductase subunit C
VNKRQARLFAIGSSAIAALAFLGLTVDSHRQFPALTNAQNITPAVTHGKAVWHKNNCINCHTLFGEGAYYAPDLTKIAQHRGAAYLQAYLRDPSKFYDEQRHRRLMPKQDMSEGEIADLVAFLDWVSKVDNQGWPPRPILVTGASIGAAGALPIGQAAAVVKSARPPGTGAVTLSAESAKDPIALGEAVFRSATPACNACHSLTPGVAMAGPSLAGVATRAQQTLASADYKGKAKDVDGYLRESITQPSAHIVAGGMYSANGVSFMPNTFGKDLTGDQVTQLVAYMASFK